jgi:hypothetical protein
MTERQALPRGTGNRDNRTRTVNATVKPDHPYVTISIEGNAPLVKGIWDYIMASDPSLVIGDAPGVSRRDGDPTKLSCRHVNIIWHK